MATNQQTNEISESDKAHKIETLRQMILNAEKTMQSAKAMLLQLEGKKKTGRRKKEEETDGTVVEGTFDGQIMVGSDGKQYPVPANYASKSKLVEGDVLKLTITSDGSFIYKQIGPAQRKSMIGIVSQDEKGNYFVFAEGKPYKVLLASVTYFKAEPGDEVVVVVPRGIETSWAAIENVISKGGSAATTSHAHSSNKNDSAIEAKHKKKFPADGGLNSWKDDFETEKKEKKEKKTEEDEQPQKKTETKKEDLVDEWTSDIEDLEKEIKAQQ
ncbi:MAG TPA: hypothetical protein PLF30_02455 [Candidatus Moranbacteria bacterium]|nr:hypothetical protein [Candidatus Moranbacteria bacterium]HPX94393.1 hypothetical protein [Candidatus Moranbacteria bacterium]HQB59403.1 hypothetical protein [Candidatus Moranbacteria bacterium]